MSKLANKLKNKGKFKKMGFEVMKSVETLAQQAVIHAALLTDPQSASVALLNQAQPSIEQLAEVQEIEKKIEKSSLKKVDSKRVKIADKVKSSTKQRGYIRNIKKAATDKNKIKNKNRILGKNIKSNNLQLAQKKR